MSKIRSCAMVLEKEEVKVSGESIYLTKPWLANYEKEVPEHIEYDELFLYDFLKRAAAEFPESPALNFQGYN